MFVTLKNISINVNCIKGISWKIKNEDYLYCINVFIFDSPIKHELIYGEDDEDIENLKKAICPKKIFKENLENLRGCLKSS